MNLDVLPTTVIAAGGKPDASWQLDGIDLMPFPTGPILPVRTKRFTGAMARNGPCATAT